MFALENNPARGKCLGSRWVKSSLFALLLTFALSAPESQAASSVTVHLTGISTGTTVFTPESAYVDVGGTVTWTEDASGYSLQTVLPGQQLCQDRDNAAGIITSWGQLETGSIGTYSATFPTAGTITYLNHHQPCT
ncbi:MAG: hypothetical protein PHC61_16225, partial [Chitinivibrionales bacterium]|nr:hypothetical protein [Chitinivibrionales bacterium]